MSNRLQSRKLLPTTYADVKALINGNQSRIEIDGYSYAAVTNRSVSLTNTVTTVICEDGLTRSDHSFKDPTDISYKIIVSKVNPEEYNRLLKLYVDRTIFKIVSMAYTCNHCMMTSFKVSDDSFDTFALNIKIIEVLYGSESSVSEMDERFQLINGRDSSVNASYTEGSSEIVSDETATVDTQINLVSNVYSQVNLTTTAINTVTSYDSFTGDPVKVGAGTTAIKTSSNDNTTDYSSSISQNAAGCKNTLQTYSHVQ